MSEQSSRDAYRWLREPRWHFQLVASGSVVHAPVAGLAQTWALAGAKRPQAGREATARQRSPSTPLPARPAE